MTVAYRGREGGTTSNYVAEPFSSCLSPWLAFFASSSSRELVFSLSLSLLRRNYPSEIAGADWRSRENGKRVVRYLLIETIRKQLAGASWLNRPSIIVPSPNCLKSLRSETSFTPVNDTSSRSWDRSFRFQRFNSEREFVKLFFFFFSRRKV